MYYVFEPVHISVCLSTSIDVINREIGSYSGIYVLFVSYPIGSQCHMMLGHYSGNKR